MGSPIYPLKQVLEVKEKRVSEAEKIVQEKSKIVEKEEAILKEKEAARDKVKQHYLDKIQQIRESGETTSPKILQMSAYSRVVKEKLVIESKHVEKQLTVVEVAKKALDTAILDLKQKRVQVDKVTTHRDIWTKEQREDERKEEEKEQDELGNMMYSSDIDKQRRNIVK